MTTWHYEKNGERCGSVSEEDITALIGARIPTLRSSQ